MSDEETDKHDLRNVLERCHLTEADILEPATPDAETQSNENEGDELNA